MLHQTVFKLLLRLISLSTISVQNYAKFIANLTEFCQHFSMKHENLVLAFIQTQFQSNLITTKYWSIFWPIIMTTIRWWHKFQTNQRLVKVQKSLFKCINDFRSQTKPIFFLKNENLKNSFFPQFFTLFHFDLT